MAIPIWLLPYLDQGGATHWNAIGWLSCRFLVRPKSYASRLLVTRVLASGGQGVTLLVIVPAPAPWMTPAPSPATTVSGSSTLSIAGQTLTGGHQHVLKLPMPGTPGDELRFRHEIEIHSQITHPRIVGFRGEVLLLPTLVDMPPLDGFLMEYITGGTLHDLVRGQHDHVADGRRRVPLREALRILVEIVDGLQVIHSRQWIHRDLKPKNVLIDVTRGRSVKLCDFGAIRDLAEIWQATDPGAIGPGTKGYIAPERITTPPITDSRGDYFAIGCLLAEMLSGQRTFARTALSTRDTAPAGLDEIRANYGHLPCELVERLLEKDPQQRLTEPKEIRERVQQILKLKPARKSSYWALNWPPLTPLEPQYSQLRKFLHEDAALYRFGDLQQVGTMMALHSERFTLGDFLDSLTTIHCLLWRTLMDLTDNPLPANASSDAIQASLRLKIDEFDKNCRELLSVSDGSFSERLKQRLQFVDADRQLFERFERLLKKGTRIKLMEQRLPLSATRQELERRIDSYTGHCLQIWHSWLKIQAQVAERIGECSDELMVALAAIR